MKVNFLKVVLMAAGWLAFWGQARADGITHRARVDFEIYEIDEKGREDRIESKSGDLTFDWITKTCQFSIRKKEYPCLFDHSEDLLNSKGELVVKALPQLKINGDQVNRLLVDLLIADDYKVKDSTRFLADLSLQSRSALVLPFYSCIDCENNGPGLRLQNAYYGQIERGFWIQHPALGKKKLKFLTRLKKMETIKGAFFSIGNDNAAEYGQ